MPLMEFTGRIIEELGAPDKLPKSPGGSLGDEVRACELAKRAVVYAASYAAQKYMDDLKEKQRILGALADCLVDVYGIDSTISRADAAEKSKGAEGAKMHIALTKLYCFDARAAVFQRLRRIAMMMADGEELDALYDNLGKLDQRYRVDYMMLQELVASQTLDDGGYKL